MPTLRVPRPGEVQGPSGPPGPQGGAGAAGVWPPGGAVHPSGPSLPPGSWGQRPGDPWALGVLRSPGPDLGIPRPPCVSLRGRSPHCLALAVHLLWPCWENLLWEFTPCFSQERETGPSSLAPRLATAPGGSLRLWKAAPLSPRRWLLCSCSCQAAPHPHPAHPPRPV